MTPWTVACQAPPSWNSPGKNAGVGSHSLLQGTFLTQGSSEPPWKPNKTVSIWWRHVCQDRGPMYVLICFSCVWLSATLWTVAHQVPLSMGFITDFVSLFLLLKCCEVISLQLKKKKEEKKNFTEDKNQKRKKKCY